MIKRKCPSCGKKIERNYGFCPWCGQSIKLFKEKENFGLLGRTDDIPQNAFNQNPMSGLPFGLDKMVGPLMKQLERELENIERQEGMPRGFNIRIQRGLPKQLTQKNEKKKEFQNIQISEEESKRRSNLPKQEAESKVRRLSDKIIYEINVPGVKDRKDVIITKLEEGFEIKVYTKEICYTKTIPLKIDIENFSIKKDKVIIEFKS